MDFVTKGKWRVVMSEKTKSALGSIPQWAMVILMGVCAFLLTRMVNQNDTVARMVTQQQTDIAVMKNDVARGADVTKQLEQLSRILESRIVRLESTRP